MSRNNLGRARVHRETATGAAKRAVSRFPPSSLDGDDLLAWHRRNGSGPTDDELSAVSLRAVDRIREADYLHYGLLADLWRTDDAALIAYFRRESPQSIQSESGARMNAYLRERGGRDVSETHGGRS
jgi:hypothetical protein